MFLLDEVQSNTCLEVSNQNYWGEDFGGVQWSDEAMSINGPIKGMRVWMLRNVPFVLR